jgi:hypothetical protein
VPHSLFHWELGSNGDGDPSWIANDGNNDLFALNNKRRMFLTKGDVLAKSDNNKISSSNSKIMEPFDSEKFQAHHTWQHLLGFNKNGGRTLFCLK